MRMLLLLPVLQLATVHVLHAQSPQSQEPYGYGLRGDGALRLSFDSAPTYISSAFMMPFSLRTMKGTGGIEVDTKILEEILENQCTTNRTGATVARASGL